MLVFVFLLSCHPFRSQAIPSPITPNPPFKLPPLPAQVNLLGCGGHARSVADILLSLNPRVELRFYDAQAKPGERVLGFPVLPPPSLPTALEGPWFPALGDGWARRRWMEDHPQADWLTLVAPSAHIGAAATLGKGVFIAAGAHVGPEAVLGTGSILNTGAILEHESTLGDFSHAAPRSTICGRSRLGQHAFLGAGAVIIDKVAVADGVMIGAGATVVHALHEPGVYGGTPAKLISSPPPIN